jgi:hypothetical protein
MNHRIRQSPTAQQSISNFLYPIDTLNPSRFPQHFLDFCRHSIEGVRGDLACAEPILRSGLTPDYDGESTLYLKAIGEDRLIPLEPAESNRPVVAVDTSTIKLGELEDGTLCALRGAIVRLEGGHYAYSRYGPLVFSLGNHSYQSLEEFGNLGVTPFAGETNVDNVLKRMRNVLERWLQFTASCTVRNGIILIDGSLTAGTPDNPAKEVERILDSARRAGSAVVAISKKTRLRIQNQSITDLLEHRPQACLLDVDDEVTDQFPPYPIRFLGRVFVVKLAKCGFPFRMDVDRQLSAQETLMSIRELTGTDIVDQGYPETLRIAHILSTFTASDVLAMQVFAAARFGVQLVPKIMLRRSLFGPFGTAWEAFH